MNDLSKKENSALLKKKLLEEEKKNEVYLKVMKIFSDAELINIKKETNND